MKKGRQAAFSHWRGPHSSRALHLRKDKAKMKNGLSKAKLVHVLTCAKKC